QRNAAAVGREGMTDALSRDRAEAAAGLPLLAARGHARSIIFGGIRQDLQLLEQVERHGRVPLFFFCSCYRAPLSNWQERTTCKSVACRGPSSPELTSPS